jgi:hypothetical protein
MRLKILRIEENIVTCEIDTGGIIDIAKMWLNQEIKENDIIEFDVQENRKK